MEKIPNKVLVYGMVFIFILSFAVPIINASNYTIQAEHKNNLKQNQVFTHTVLGEEATATWCGYCPGASAQLYQVYNMGHDFEFVTLVADKNSYASGRCSELGVTGYPTVAFDGGYIKISGLQPDYTYYENAVINCGSRSVANIDLDVDAFWLGGGQILVNAEVQNNGGSTYSGHLHVYITEETSRWDDASGAPYHYAMINNYAINQNIQISASATESYSNTWSGYSDISISNIRVIASVFSPTNTDETDATDPEYPNSDSPSTPSQPSGPSTGIVGIPNTYSTSSTEPNGDSIKYGFDWDADGDVDEWTNYKPSGQSVSLDHSWDAPGSYNFQVKAEDQFGDQSGWSPTKSVQITTGTPPNTPSAPTGEIEGTHNRQYTYHATTTDPDAGDKLYYKFDWDDGSDSGWKGPYTQGQDGSASHKWTSAGSFDIKVKAKDLAGSETDWSPALTVIMDNTAPGRPSKPSGPSHGIIRKTYSYSTSSSDPEGDSIQYKFDWGDGSQSGWISLKTAEYSWSEEGTYSVRTIARDNWDESVWSAPLSVEIFSGDLDINAGGSYDGKTGQIINFFGSASGGTEPYIWEWDFGDGETSSQQNPTHAYSVPGEYFVSLLVTDDDGAEGVNITTANITSNPPNTPTITGSDEGTPDTPYEFTISAIDPDGDDVYFWIEWYEGDPEASWVGPYESGEEVIVSNSWSEKGSYTISVKAKDIYEEISDTARLDVTMPRSIQRSWLVKIIQILQDKFPIINLFFS